MSDPCSVLLVGATGLVGGHAMEVARTVPTMHLVALARREAPMPRGARMEMIVADPLRWPEAVATLAPDAVICALGSTWRKAGRNEAAFRAIDHDLVVALAAAAKDSGTETFVLVSSVGADAHAKTHYLRVKGETEAAITRLRFRRFDILQPGLLRGKRGGDRRLLERLAILASPLTDRLLRGPRRKYRSIRASVVAAAAIQCAGEKAQGRFVHDNDAIARLAHRIGNVE